MDNRQINELIDEVREELEKWRVTDDASAEWIIDKTEEDLIELRRYKMSLENKIAVLKDKFDKAKREEEWRIARRNSMLLEYFESIDDKLKRQTKTQIKYRLPSGSIIKKFPEPEYVVNEEQLLKWTKESNPDFVEVKETVKWAELKKNTIIVEGQLVYKDTGELVEGVELKPRAPFVTFKEE